MGNFENFDLLWGKDLENKKLTQLFKEKAEATKHLPHDPFKWSNEETKLFLETLIEVSTPLNTQQMGTRVSYLLYRCNYSTGLNIARRLGIDTKYENYYMSTQEIMKERRNFEIESISKILSFLKSK